MFAGFILIPGALVEKGLCHRSSNTGTFEVPGKGVEVARKCGTSGTSMLDPRRRWARKGGRP